MLISTANTIEITNHGFNTGDKVIHTASRQHQVDWKMKRCIIFLNILPVKLNYV
jgi:hypothetical protein